MICFAWDGFPQYAARCVGAFVRSTSERVVVAATRPRVPIQRMEKLCCCQVEWVERDDPRSLKDLFGEVPRFMVVSGWYVPCMRNFNREVKGAGGKVVSIVDNNYLFAGWRCLRSWQALKAEALEWLKVVRYRLFIRRHFDGFFVPGKSGRRLLHRYGVSDDRIVEGVYSADASIFHDGKPLPEREKKIIYVGQFIERKNVRRMLEAFVRSRCEVEGDSGWELHLYGSGPLKDELNQTIKRSNNQTIHIHDFVQPEQLASLYQSARLFCLPSLWEHWGLVVHEAALSGCPLLLSSQIGAADDLLVEGKNGWTFDQYCVDDMARVLKRAMELDDAALSAMQTESLRMAKNASLEKFVSGVKKMIA